ncbi:MAG: hypothetical protein WCH86_03320 [Kiritimatiellales bacterium]
MEQNQTQASWQHAALIGFAILMVVTGGYRLLANWVANETSEKDVWFPFFLGVIVLLVDCFTFGFKKLPRRMVAAGIAFGTLSAGIGVLGLIFGTSKLGSPMSSTESFMFILCGLGTLAIFRFIKSRFYPQTKFEDMTIKK